MTLLLIAMAAGIWLTAAPQLVGYGDLARTAHQIIGPIAATVACIACTEAVRSMRWLNVGLGSLIVVLAVIPGFSSVAASLVAVPTGAVVAALSALAPKASRDFNGGWRALVGPR